MQHDVAPLWDFYYDRHLGKVAQRSLHLALRRLWPRCHGLSIAGYGFAAPLLRPFRGEAQRTICLMPNTQGARVWPREGPGLTALVEEGRWPLPNGFLDRLIVAHAVETEAALDALMEEIWRVLAPDGRAIVIAPNRSGMWARGETTPFGVGRPFSYGQLETMFKAHKMEPITRAAALYMPPSDRRYWLRAAPTLERIGTRMEAQRFAGVLMVEGVKRVFAMPGEAAREHSGSLLKPIRNLAPPAASPVGNRRRTNRRDAA